MAVDGAQRMSTFYGYYVLQARAKAGDYQGCLDCIRQYWGAMLDLGATTFWEDFDLEWTANAARIDELVPPGKKDIHGDFGNYCYKGFRHSLCHGWASGPTAWLSRARAGRRGRRARLQQGPDRAAPGRPAVGGRDVSHAAGHHPRPARETARRHRAKRHPRARRRNNRPVNEACCPARVSVQVLGHCAGVARANSLCP